MGQHEQVIADCDKALQLNPKHPVVSGIRQTAIENHYCQPAYKYYQDGNYDLALKAFSEAVKLDPSFVKAYIGRGSIYAKLGKLKEAVMDIDKALELDPYDNDLKILKEKLIEGKA